MATTPVAVVGVARLRNGSVRGNMPALSAAELEDRAVMLPGLSTPLTTRRLFEQSVPPFGVVTADAPDQGENGSVFDGRRAVLAVHELGDLSGKFAHGILRFSSFGVTRQT